MSSVSPQASNETSGILNTSLNIGSSLGTSLAGAIILSVFVGTSTSLIQQNSNLSPQQQTQLEEAFTSKAQIVSNAQLEQATSHLTPPQQQYVIEINDQARQKALTTVYYGLGVIGFLGILAGLRLPHTRPLAEGGEPAAAPLPEAAAEAT
jgi:hypothetical protein